MRVILAWSCQNPLVRAYIDDGELTSFSGELLLF